MYALSINLHMIRSMIWSVSMKLHGLCEVNMELHYVMSVMS